MNKKEKYIHDMDRRRRYARPIKMIDRILTYLTFVSYPVMLIYLLIAHQLRNALIFLLVPAVGFIIVTIIRDRINEQRPYEVYEYPSVIEKSTHGHSFPSRHAFSIFMIAVTFLFENLALGICFMALGVILAVIRVISGVHFAHDVVAGALSAVIYGCIAYALVF